MKWVETKKELPPVDKSVLGWYPPGYMEVVVYSRDRWNKPGYVCSEYRDPPEYWTVLPPLFLPESRLRKKSGSQWQGKVVGWYSTELTPEGYAVESEFHAGSVQIYPASALERIRLLPNNPRC